MTPTRLLPRTPLAAVTIAVVLATTAPPAAAPTSCTVWHVRLSDSGRTLHVERGDFVRVRLPGGASGGFHKPRTSDRDILRRRWADGGYPSDDPARAEFRARQTGTADLTAYDDYTCLHTEPRCLPPQRQWIVHVVVE